MNNIKSKYFRKVQKTLKQNTLSTEYAKNYESTNSINNDNSISGANITQ